MDTSKMLERAQVLKKYGSLDQAVESGELKQFEDITVSEAIVLGLHRQGVIKYFAIFGHGTIDIAEALRIYEEAGVVKVYNMRHETAAAHAATALKWMTGETSAVVSSIGPGSMHAFAGSLCSASNGIGVYHIYGDETTHNEGFNMQQIPKDEQGLFLKMTSIMGDAYTMIEPWSVIAALRAGATATNGVGFNKPFFLLAPMNSQPALLKEFNLLELPKLPTAQKLVCTEEEVYEKATQFAKAAKKITIKLGAGAKSCGKEVIKLANLLDAAIVSGPNSTGIVPYSEKRYMTVGGSKGSLSGNFAMNEADLVIIIGARAVCQWDSSGTAWKNAKNIINFNINPLHANHYNRSVAIVGDAKSNLNKWIDFIEKAEITEADGSSEWAKACFKKREEWIAFKKKRYDNPTLYDEVWKTEVLTQPAAIKAACEIADRIGAVKLFDAGDVQANGFQAVEDENEKQTITDTGASYMGFASSAVMATAACNKYAMAFCGDGSFIMNPQILIDGVEHGAKGCLIIFDNRRMAAITGLQYAQFNKQFKTHDSVEVDYIKMASSVKGVKALDGGKTLKEFKAALEEAIQYYGISVVVVPVYFGNDELGGLGVFGDWNIGNWCERVQKEHHSIGL